MIKFSLKCAKDHIFESWFQSSEAFDKLQKAGLVSCEVCGAPEVRKSLMAPPVRTAKGKAQSPEQERPLSTAQSPEEAALAKMRKHVEDNSEYVGLKFAAEARKMHEDGTKRRAIWGEAKPEEAKKLIEEGVPVAPLPFMPPRKTN